MHENLPKLGVGLGYRYPLHQEILNHQNSIDFLEVITDQYLYSLPEKLESWLEIVQNFPLVTHGVSMSIGTAMPLNLDYINRLKSLIKATKTPWYSDHLCFTKVPEIDVEQLVPLWFTEESLNTVCQNIQELKRHITTPFLLENITYYFPIPNAEMTESQFITRVLQQTDCGMLLDVNNVHINSINLGYDPYKFLMSIPLDRVVQIHLAGGRKSQGIIIDTHDTSVHDTVWDLLKFVVANSSVKAISLEWDQNFPAFEHLIEHLNYARQILKQYS
jgi:uncharacterized protein